MNWPLFYSFLASLVKIVLDPVYNMAEIDFQLSGLSSQFSAIKKLLQFLRQEFSRRIHPQLTPTKDASFGRSHQPLKALFGGLHHRPPTYSIIFFNSSIVLRISSVLP